MGSEVVNLGFGVTARMMHDGAEMKPFTISLIFSGFACQWDNT